MKDLPVRTLIAVLLIGLLCLVVWFGGWVQAAVLGLFTVAAVYEMFTIFVKRGIQGKRTSGKYVCKCIFATER